MLHMYAWQVSMKMYDLAKQPADVKLESHNEEV